MRGWLRVSGVRRCERPSVGSSALAALPAATAKADRSREAFQRLMGRFGQPGRQASLVCLCRSVLHWDARCARISCVSHARSGCCRQLRAVFFVHRVVHVNCLTAIAITERSRKHQHGPLLRVATALQSPLDRSKQLVSLQGAELDCCTAAVYPLLCTLAPFQEQQSDSSVDASEGFPDRFRQTTIAALRLPLASSPGRHPNLVEHAMQTDAC